MNSIQIVDRIMSEKKPDDHRINQACKGNFAYNMSHKIIMIFHCTVLCLCCFLREAKLEKAGPQYIPVPASRLLLFTS